MPIGLAIGASAVTAGVGIYTSSKAAKAQKKAGQQAADTSLQTAQMNNDLFRETRDKNVALASPYYNNGLLASNALTDLLLGTHLYNQGTVANPNIPGGGTFPTSGPGSGTESTGYSGPTFGQILAMPHKGSAYESAFNNFVNYYQAHPNEDPGIASRSQIDALSGDSIKGSENAMRAIFDTYQASPNKVPTTVPGAPATPAAAPAGALAGTAAPAPAAAAPSALAGVQTNPVDSQTPLAGNAALAGREGVNDLAAPVGQAGGGAPAQWWQHPAPGGALAGAVTTSAPQAGATPATAATPTGTTTPAAGTPAPSALSAWDQFRQGTNYQWRFNEGNRALITNYAVRGMGDSGAERIALQEQGQNFASNELSNYMNLLAGQQNVGLTAGNAVMGVSTSAANAIAGQNTNAGNAAANAQLVAGQASAQNWGNIGGAIGQAAGAIGGALGGMPSGGGGAGALGSFAPGGVNAPGGMYANGF